MTNILTTVLMVFIFILVFIILPILAINLFLWLAPGLLLVYILYIIFGRKKPRQSMSPPPSEDVVDVQFTVHEVEDDKDA